MQASEKTKSNWTVQRRQQAQHDAQRRAAANVALAIDRLASKLGYRQVCLHVRARSCLYPSGLPLPGMNHASSLYTLVRFYSLTFKKKI